MNYKDKEMKGKYYWILTINHTCAICGHNWVSYVRQYYAKPEDKKLRYISVIDRKHCINKY